ncbi:conserved protein of unknown function [Blastococcus saxobsidens DD2]|uniref:Uncharacterized protein n=2 Tax=Blastococcus saxobsidens TaxID=138336 RepID=H6RQ72_BLASD|nr:conserved protein of unknown function [Blastococcus saxobsidens DD2]
MTMAPRMRLHLLDAVAGMHPTDAAVRCLALAYPELPDPAGLPLGQRDAALLGLRARLLGDRLVAWTSCDSCGEQSTLELSVAELLEQMGARTEKRWVLQHQGDPLPVRALTSRDLARAAGAPSPEEARDLLVAAALDQVTEPQDAPPLDDELAAAVAASLAEHDPGSEVLLAGSCAVCGEQWSHMLDPARYVVAELAHLGARLLAEVAELARAFGWTEADVLALSDQRRRAYLELASEMTG